MKVIVSFKALISAILIISHAPVFASMDEQTKTEQTFNQEINQFNLFLKNSFNANIHLSKNWNNNHPTFSASAMSMSGQVISVSGYDYRSNSLAAFRLGLCHEAGHYLAGKPFLQLNPNSIANTVNRMDLSAEGQADYFAPYCLKKYFDYLKSKNLEISTVIASTNISVTSFCNNQINNPAEKQKCAYVATAALDLINYLNSHYSNTKDNAAITLDAYKNTQPVFHTLNHHAEYPTLNCRLKTFLAGTLCENDSLPVDQFVCTSGQGARPDCWYQED
ncbi:MAG: hypothetical protein ACXVCY_09860 [Pseudobdellovibrionaceae bacterium]